MSCVGTLYINGEGLKRLIPPEQAGPCDVRDICHKYSSLIKFIEYLKLKQFGVDDVNEARAVCEKCDVLGGDGCSHREELRRRK